MYLLGIDVGTSSIKVAVLDFETHECIASAQYPDEEAIIISEKPGYAEQDPMEWWHHVQQAILKCNALKIYNPKDIKAIGIAYQMHGLVMVDKNQEVLRHSIIWCDSRAVEIGEEAFQKIGTEDCLHKLLNSPGNFTASKLAWVKNNEPAIYEKMDKFMLPGDFISMKLTGTITTTISALSEGIFWDFREDQVSADVMNYYGLSQEHIPEIRPLFGEHGTLTKDIAQLLGLTPGIPITYKSGDQPNNALSLNVMKPGEVAATAGTSGVIYGVSDDLTYDKKSRINTFAHVNYTPAQQHTGVLLCINGTGSLYRWAKNNFAPQLSYPDLNAISAKSPIGSKGLKTLPFGNGAERMLENKYTGAQFVGVDLNIHNQADLFRSVQESIAYAFRFGLDIMRENGMNPSIIKAGHTNLFLSDIFTQTFVDITGIPVELYDCDGAVGASIGAGIGASIFKRAEDAFAKKVAKKVIRPLNSERIETHYQDWKKYLEQNLANQQ